MKIDIGAILTRANKATPGEWKTSGARYIWSPEARSNIAVVSEPRGELKEVGYEELQLGSENANEAYANAVFIAHARKDVVDLARGYDRLDDLLDEIMALQEDANLGAVKALIKRTREG